MKTKRRTVGLDIKLPVQAFVTIVVWLIAHFAGIELSQELEAAIAVMLGAVAAAAAPAPETEIVVQPGGTS